MIEANPYESPKAPTGYAERPTPGRQRAVSVLVGGAVGCLTGLLWAAAFAPAIAEPAARFAWGAIFATMSTITGVVVGIVRSGPVIVGLVAGCTISSLFCFVAGPIDGGIVVWIMILGPSNAVIGVVVGFFYWLAYRFILDRRPNHAP